MTAAGASSAGRGQPLGEPAVDLGADVRWEELLHDWLTRSEHDGGYTLLRCRVCGTETLR